MLFILKFLAYYLSLLIFVLLSVAFFTLVERQMLGSMQRRQGPNIVGFYGIFQAISDGVKLLLKESVFPLNADMLIFFFAPVFAFTLALCMWTVIPFNYGFFLTDFDFGILYIFTISALSVHSIIMAGWSSNSKYAFLGALRSAAQMISYEVSLGVTIVSIVLLTRSFNLNDIALQQTNIWFILPLFPMFLIFSICALAETNRHPFDLPEAESELVSGYNVEYAAIGFALFFLAEYSNMLAMSCLGALFFLGGWGPFLNFQIFSLIPNPVNFSLKILLFVYLFVVARGTFPRYRYDQLMRLGWKVFLPFSLAYVVILACWLIGFNQTLRF